MYQSNPLKCDSNMKHDLMKNETREATTCLILVDSMDSERTFKL